MCTGNAPDREELFIGDATSVDEGVPGAPGPVTHGIPVVGASFANGVALTQAGSTAFIEVLPAEDPHGAEVLEGYPIEPPPGKTVIWDEASVGLVQVFLEAG